MAILISRSPEETAAAGEAWAREAAPGWVIGLMGDLGAGKTQLVKGFARGLGIAARVHSPTFALVHEYAGGRLPLHHLDLYRLETPQQIAGAGLDEYLLSPPGVAIVEWIERWFTSAGAKVGIPSPIVIPSTVSRRFRLVRIEIVSEHERRIVHEDAGP
jgi:tRNA threonylcarbamoyladenosine biosynthesis protein TsaE